MTRNDKKLSQFRAKPTTEFCSEISWNEKCFDANKRGIATLTGLPILFFNVHSKDLSQSFKTIINGHLRVQP